MTECLFCRVAAGSLEAATVFEDPLTIAILDHRPLFPGHCLLLPKGHYETLLDLPDALLAPLFANARLLAQAMETGLQAEGSFVAVNNRISQSVPHLHVHIVPRRRKDGLRGFFWPRHPYPDETQRNHARDALRDAIARIRRAK